MISVILRNQKKMLNVKFSTEIPDIYYRLRDTFGHDNVRWDDGIIIANKDTIHCKFTIPEEKVVHEVVHLEQQEKIGIDLWWETYLSNISFRLEQELEACCKEYRFLKKYIKNREIMYKIKQELANNLSSKQYGSIISYIEALKLIK